MKILSILVIFIYSFFITGCLWQEEDKRESISMGLSPKGMYDLAYKSIDSGATDEALKIFERIKAAYPSSKYALQSELDIAYRLFKRERYEDTIQSLNETIKKYPNHFITPYAYYLRGLAAESMSKSLLDIVLTDNAERDTTSVKNAFNYYMSLIKKFPESEYSSEAKSRLITLRNILARHELYVAIFYTKQKAFIAAINRCKFIIEKYPNTPSVPAALHLMAHNYDLIDAIDLAKDSRRILKSNYPKYKPHYSLNN